VSDYTVLRAADAPEYTGGSPSPFFGYGRPMGSEQLALNMRVLAPGAAHVPPGGDPERGHSHVNIEEIYLVLDGELRMKLGDEVETLRQYDAVLIPPGTPRGARNEGDDVARLLMVSRRVEDPRTESVPVEGFWPA